MKQFPCKACGERAFPVYMRIWGDTEGGVKSVRFVRYGTFCPRCKTIVFMDHQYKRVPEPERVIAARKEAANRRGAGSIIIVKNGEGEPQTTITPILIGKRR